MKSMLDIEKFEYGDMVIFVSKINGNNIAVRREAYDKTVDWKPFLIENDLFVPIAPAESYDPSLIKTPVISLHVSSDCNMCCRYCFKKVRRDSDLTMDEVKRFIDLIADRFPDANRYIVDMAGSGEPLLNKKLVFETAAYCRRKSDELKREVLPMLVTNGLLLDSETVKALQEAGILFGVSIDGNAATHDKNRVDRAGKGTYKRIVGNVKKIAHREFVGAAVTVGAWNPDVLKTFKHLSKIFPTVSMKPVRAETHWRETVDRLNAKYDKLADYILKNALRGKLGPLGNIINGDDYFGKFILRTFTNKKFVTRCDAGIGRFSLSTDRKIYSCPAACDREAFVLGSLQDGVDGQRVREHWELLSKRSECGDCSARFVCGGECMLVSYSSYNRKDRPDPDMCRFKKHLFRLAVIMKAILQSEASEVFQSVVRRGEEIAKRNERDEELIRLSASTGNGYAYTQLKKLKDENAAEFEKIKAKAGPL